MMNYNRREEVEPWKRILGDNDDEQSLAVLRLVNPEIMFIFYLNIVSLKGGQLSWSWIGLN